MKRSQPSQDEKLIRLTLAVLLEIFLKKNEHDKKVIAELIDEFSTQILANYEDKLSENFKECIEGFQDFHHWGASEITPQYTLCNIKKIVKYLGKLTNKS